MKTNKTNLKRLDILGNADHSSADHSSADHSSDRAILTTLLKQGRQKLGYCSVFAAVPAILASHLTEPGSDEAKKPEASAVEYRGRGARLEKLNISGSSPALLKRQSEFLLPHQKGSFDMFAELGGNDNCPGREIPGGTYTAAAPYIDSGDTRGANDTVSRVSHFYYHYTDDAFGPDRIYSFILTGLGPNPQIEISPTSGTYRPLIYLLQEGASGCPTGTGNLAQYSRLADHRWPIPKPIALTLSYLPLNVPLYLFVDSARNDGDGSGTYSIRIQDVTIATAASPNSIDLAEIFVRQHYSDFLNREPDAGGLAYWTNEITRCEGDAACIHRRRIGVSAAFFIEQEFQETSYYIYRFYKASFDRAPNYTEFTSDRSRVMRVANLEASKQAFAVEWVQRPAFVAAYPATMSNTEVVNKLFDSAGLTASRYDALRQQEISAMNAGRSRAMVLRDVIEIPDFKNVPDPHDARYNELKQVSQYNPAFVLMQYFGYLRRDVDQGGYDFWLDVVNDREPNNYRGMVCAFLTSTEYQLRFGSTVTRSNADCAQ